MGKTSHLKSLVNMIAKVVLHTVLARHTNRAESVTFLNHEIDEYRANAEEKAQSYNWNNEDRENVKKEALNLINKYKTTKYSDVEFPEKEIDKVLDEVIEEIMGS